jgi:hypothetical protein
MIEDPDEFDDDAFWQTVGITSAALIGLAILAFVLSSKAAPARTLYPGQWAQVDPEMRQWFNNQKIPGGPMKGVSCCSVADGVYAQEDIRHGHYWTQFQWRKWDSAATQYVSADSDWMQVPDDAVIKDPNRHGAPVVWWGVIDEKLIIRCYAPGAGL